MNTMKDSRRIHTSIIFLMAAMRVASAQTLVDLASQSKNVDFSKAVSTKPAQAGPTIPPGCSTGQIFFDTAAPAGQNLYACTATNTWSLEDGTGGGSGTAMASQFGDFNIANSSSTVQTLGGVCSNVTPCQIRTGAVLFTMTVPVTVTLGGTPSNGTIFWYLSSLQVLTAGHNSAATLTCSAGCSVATGVTSFPPDSIPLWRTTFVANVLDAISFVAMDKRAIYSRDIIAVGPGVSSVSDPSTGIQTFSTDPTQVPRYFTGSGAPSGTCTAGRDFYTDTTGLNLYFCDAANTWKQVSGGGASRSTDFLAVDTSATVQTIGGACSLAAPCQIRLGTQVFTMTAPVSATLSGTSSSGTVFWYLSSAFVLTAGYNSGATLTCSAGCTVATGITAFPPDSTPLWQTTFTANVWDPIVLATMDKRAVYSRDIIAPGSGVASNVSGGIQTLSTDPTQVPRYFTGSGAPAIACTAGRDIYTDTTGLNRYFCDATNIWARLAPAFPTAAVTLTAGTGVTSVTCTSATCDVNGGSLTIVGGTATTGTVATIGYTGLGLLLAPRTCLVVQNGGATHLGIGHGAPSTTSFTVTSAVTVSGVTFNVDYSCKQ
jgi:hypothetical protein